jgi:hypothetical protein
VLSLGLVCSLAHREARATPLDPLSFTSLGTLTVTSGTLTIDTSSLAMSGAASFTGVVHAQGTNLPDLAVFTFDSISIASGATIMLRPLRRERRSRRGSARQRHRWSSAVEKTRNEMGAPAAAAACSCTVKPSMWTSRSMPAAGTCSRTLSSAAAQAPEAASASRPA